MKKLLLLITAISMLNLNNITYGMKSSQSLDQQLYDAAQYGYITKVKKLIDAGANVNMRQQVGAWTPLYVAVYGDKIDMVKLLLKEGANPNPAGLFPLHLAAAVGQKDILIALLSAGADPHAKVTRKGRDTGKTPLDLAQSDAIKTILLAWMHPPRAEVKPTIARKKEKSDNQQFQLLLKAVANNNATQFQRWLKNNRAKLNRKTEYGYPLHLAILANADFVARSMIKEGADITQKDGYGLTPINLANTIGSRAELISLLKPSPEQEFFTALSKPGNKEILERLIKQINLNIPGSIKKGGKKTLPLHIAIEHGNKPYIHLLLAAGAKPDTKDEKGETALHKAATLHTADNWKKEVFMELLDYKPDVNSQNISGETPLNRAAFFGDTAAIKALLQAGANPNIGDEKGSTPLHRAAVADSPESINLLLFAGADMDSKNERGDTPLDMAQSMDRLYSASLLKRFPTGLSNMQLLGVYPFATASELKKAYHKRALIWHPDKVKDRGISDEKAIEMFKMLSSAYRELIKELEDKEKNKR